MTSTKRQTLDHVILTTRTDNTIIDVCEVEYRGTGTMSPTRYHWHMLKTFFVPKAKETLYASILPQRTRNGELRGYHPPTARRYYAATYVDKSTAEMWRDIVEERRENLPHSMLVKRRSANDTMR